MACKVNGITTNNKIDSKHNNFKLNVRSAPFVSGWIIYLVKACGEMRTIEPESIAERKICDAGKGKAWRVHQDLSDVILELPMPDYLLCCSPYLCPGRVESTRRLSQNLSVLGGVDGSGWEYLPNWMCRAPRAKLEGWLSYFPHH